MQNRKVSGVIFDMDGTLVDSGLDFDLMRREMELPDGIPILEAIQQLDAGRKTDCLEILARHEAEGVLRATPMPGVAEFLDELRIKEFQLAVLTRNSRQHARQTLERLSLKIEMLVAREDAPAKPNPEGVHLICRHWNLLPARVAVIGDYLFDLLAGKNAGAKAILFTQGQPLAEIPWHTLADRHLHSFQSARELLEWFEQPD